ncbi:MAG: hypothetical protein C0524_08495 [Rhodobacter sp.]|nr:hypothetical protein [Rhodobacter sp.]
MAFTLLLALVMAPVVIVSSDGPGAPGLAQQAGLAKQIHGHSPAEDGASQHGATDHEHQISAILAGSGKSGFDMRSAPEAAAEPGPAVSGWRDETVFSLAPTGAEEIKLVMAASDVATFEWVSEGGGVNYTQHGDDGRTNEDRFEGGRTAPGQEGTMTAPLTGKLGWFRRNRGDAPVTVALRTGGANSQIGEVE